MLLKIEIDRGSQLFYMYRLPFASGNVFSANMLDTLLYQSYFKNYLIDIIKLMLNIDQNSLSGHLSSVSVYIEPVYDTN
jgi:potassium channel subfamily T protein 1